MQSKTTLTLGLGLALAIAAPMALRADDAAASTSPAAEAKPAMMAKPAAAAADASASTTDAKAAPTPVAKNDAPGSIMPGNQLNDDGKFAEAAAYFDGIGEQTASNGHKKREPWRLIGLAKAQIGLGKFDDAAATAQKAIDIDPKNGTAWNVLGSSQAQAGKREDAAATYAKGIDTLKAAGVDTAKLEANLAPIKAALDAAKAKADKAAGKTDAAASMSGTADAKPAAAPMAASGTADSK
jgi:tetratricopeptide (TPR) repeat protein